MSINATRSEGNTDRMNGYLEGYASGQKCGSEIMKMKACREFSKIIAEICPHFTKDDIDELETVFRKDLEK
jgi:hypothetical protein